MASFRPFTDMWGWKACGALWFDAALKADEKRRAKRARARKAAKRA